MDKSKCNQLVKNVIDYENFTVNIGKYPQSFFQKFSTARCDIVVKSRLTNQLKVKSNETYAKISNMITTQPSLSSKGFENSFKILQTQVEKNIYKSIKLLNLINPDNNYPKMYFSTKEGKNSSLKIVLMAMERLEEFVNNFLPAYALDTAVLFMTFLYDFVTRNMDNSDSLNQSFPSYSMNDRNIIYHIGRGADGSKCLKVVGSLLSSNTVLCGNRVSQMTRTYDDIEAVTRLLEEKGKDLELTVQIGKELLTQNSALEYRISELEADLKSANEDRTQLVHELHKKNELIAVLTNDVDDNSDNDTPTFSKSLTFDLLQKKINSLQDENKSLKLEASQLASQTEEVEAFERKLMVDIKVQLNDANKQFENLNLELERQREENRLQHEQIVSLTTRLSESEMRLQQLNHDNDEHITLLNITKENQNSLALELVEFKQRYQEVLALLQEAQEHLRKHRKKAMPQVRGSFATPLFGLQIESLQSELMESSLYSENSIDSGISGDTQRYDDRILRNISQISAGGANATLHSILPQYRRIFDTVKCANKNISVGSNETPNTYIGGISISSAAGICITSSVLSNNHIQETAKTFSCESLSSQWDDDYTTQPIGVPGVPGAKELEAALKRLTPGEVLARRAMLSFAPIGSYTYDDQKPSASAAIGIRTPDSIMSTGSSSLQGSSNMSVSMYPWRLPEKLQIVKPIEGSQTLYNWLRLATPTLSGLLEERPGVTIRGGRDLEDLGLQTYTLSDIEEDVNEEMPGKQFESLGCTYTYITSTVMHPDDGIANDLSFLSQTQLSSRLASTSTSRQTSCPQTPRAELSRKNSCSTFSVNLGLASMLNERGIKAVTPSALNSPAGPNYSPTVTPCNSPEGSPIRSKTPEPLLGILYSGADLIRRKLTRRENERRSRKQQQQKIVLTRLERRALRSLRLVEKVESIGLENIITTQPNTISQLASGIANRSSSPLAQLNNLTHIHTKSNNTVSDLHFDRRQIKDVLQKGLNSQWNQSLDTVKTSTVTNTINQMPGCAKVPIKQSLQMSTESEQMQEIELSANQSMDNTISTQIKQLQRQKSRRQMKNGQRSDLGTIGGRIRSDLGRVSSIATDYSVSNQQTLSTPNVSTMSAMDNKETQPTLKQSFAGTVSSLLFGRKGGWL